MIPQSSPSPAHEQPATLEKALRLNLAQRVYGTFAEIGAGQEIANWFFRAGGASGTVAKTMSAYDMTFSDEIYGKSQRYVSRQRMQAMLDHEYAIVVERLGAKRGDHTTFFALANTVRARSFRDTHEECHGWMGLRFQTRPGGASQDIQLHFRLLDSTHSLQAEALGVLGVNLLYAAFHLRESLPLFLRSLMDGLTRWRIEIDMVDFSGEDFSAQEFEDRLVALELVRCGLCDAALFGPDGNILQVAEALYRRPVFLSRGTFDPITRVNLDMLEKGIAGFREEFGVRAEGLVEVCEITMRNLLSEAPGAAEHQHFLARAGVLQSLGKHVLISKHAEFHRLSSYLARHTRAPVGIVLGLPLFEELFNERWYLDLDGGLLEAFGRLFKSDLRLYVYPAGDPVTGRIRTGRQANVLPQQRHLLDYLLEIGGVRCLQDCLEQCVFVSSAGVRQMWRNGDPAWRRFVPPLVLQREPWATGFGGTKSTPPSEDAN